MPSLRVGLQATVIYVAVAALGMAFVYRVNNATYGTTEMISQFWIVQLILTCIVLFYVLRYFGFAAAGFGRSDWRALIWLAPAYATLTAMWVPLTSRLLDGTVMPTQWQMLGLLTFTTFLIGFSEEVMFRGVLLRAALVRRSVVYAMLLSAALFSLLHVVNLLGGQSFGNTMQQLAFAFLVGFFLAPMAIKIGNLWPLIIWHWMWNLALFSGNLLGVLHPFAFLGVLIQVVIGLWLWAEVMRQG